ncbi:MAG TPA: DUF3987 domain-containing protein [Candidatus Syntrophosphaera thermopropionivorans]|nr:DUF3987 domain-containing protein [Candidatus Syntrophosphaera thermopropionivorans]
MKDSIQSIFPEIQGSQCYTVSEDTISEPNFNDVITLQTEDNLLSAEEAIQTSNNTNNIKGTNIMTKSITNSKESINYTGVKMKQSFQSIVPEIQGSQCYTASEDTVTEHRINDVATLQTEDNLLSAEEAIQTSNNTNNIKGNNIMTNTTINSLPVNQETQLSLSDESIATTQYNNHPEISLNPLLSEDTMMSLEKAVELNNNIMELKMTKLKDNVRNSSVSHRNSANENDPLTLVTMGKDVKNPELLEYRTLDEIINDIKSGQHKAKIETIRNTANVEERKALKTKLPYFIYGIIQDRRSDGNVRQMNGLIIDIDDVADIEEGKKELEALPCARYIFRSPYNGIKVIIPFNRPVTDKDTYMTLWKYCALNIRDLIGTEPDDPSGWSQACFLSYDPDIVDLGEEHFLNVEDTILIMLQTEEKSESSHEQKCNQYSQEETINNSISAVEHLSQRKIKYRDWLRCGIAIYNYYKDIGKLDEGKTLWLSFADNPNYQDTDRELEKIWEKIAKNTYSQIHIGTLFYIAQEYGWKVPKSQQNNIVLMVPLDKSKLPPMFQEYIETVNKITNAPDGVILTAMLPYLAVSIGNHMYIKAFGIKHYCNIYAILIGPSSRTHKSTCMNLARYILKEENYDLIRNKITDPALLKELKNKPNLLLVFSEMGSLFQNFKQDYNKPMVDDITDLFNGYFNGNSTLDYSVFIKDTALSIIGAITNDSFDDASKHIIDRGCGFFQRFISCYVPVNYYSYNDVIYKRTQVSFDDIRKYNDMTSFFVSLPGSYELRYNAEAESYINGEYSIKYNQLQQKEGREGEFNTRLYTDYLYRFSIMIYAVKRWEDMREAKDLEEWFEENPIDKETVLQAEYMCDYYRKNSILIISSWDDKYTLDNMQKLIKCLDSSPEHRLNKTNISKAFNNHLSKEKMEKYIHYLLELDLIEQEEEIVRNSNNPPTYFKLK